MENDDEELQHDLQRVFSIDRIVISASTAFSKLATLAVRSVHDELSQQTSFTPPYLLPVMPISAPQSNRDLP